jgi:hypothetical protein
MPQAPTVEFPKRLPLVITPENRGGDTTKDARLVNCYCEREIDGSYRIYKRGGLLLDAQPPGAAANGYGATNWLGDVYTIFGDKLYKNGSALAGTVDTTNGVYRFDSCKGATPKLQMGNGVKAYNYDGASGLVLINDIDFPAAFVKGWSYLNGVTYVGTTAARIQGSATNDPTSWDPLNVLVAQIEPDAGVALNKQLVYTVMLKQWSTEFFYDAGNATGSPLGSVQGAKIGYGCAHQDSVQRIDDSLFWLSTNRSASHQVVKLEGLKATVVSYDPIERLLDKVDLTTIYSFTLRNIGHRFYVLTSVASNITLAYDIDENMWWQWTDVDGNYFPFVAATYNSSLQTVLQHATNGKLYFFDETYYTDAGDTITVDIITPNFDGETNRKKQMTAMKFIADQTPGSVLQVRKNDNDFAVDKWSNFRRVDLSKQQPMLTNCGSFVRRAHHFRHQSHTAFRMKAVEMQLDLGTL